MDSFLQQHDLPGLNGLLEKHKQMQERSAIKSQAQMMHSGINFVNPVNPGLQHANGLFLGSPAAMVPFTNHYFMGSPVQMQCANGYYNPNPILQPVNSFFNPTPVLQPPPSSYFNPNSMLQTPAGTYFDPSAVLPNPTNFFNPNPLPQFPVPQNYLNQNLMMRYDNYFDPNPVPQYQNNAYIQNPVTPCLSSTYPPNFMPQFIIGGNPGVNPVPQCTINNNFSQTAVTHVANSNFNRNAVPQSVNRVVNKNFASTNKPNYPKEQKPQGNVPVSTGKVYVNPRYIHVNRKFISDAKEANCSKEENSDIPCASETSTTSVPAVATDSSAETNFPSVSENTQAVESCSSEKSKQDDGGVLKSENNDSSENNANSSIVILTRSKLVRIKKSPMKLTVAPRKRLPSTGLKKLKISPKKNLTSANQSYSMSKMKYINSATKKMSRRLGLISIDGVLYNKSRNQLIRSNSSLVKRKLDSISDKSVEYYVAEDGKKLLKLDIVKKKSVTSPVKSNTTLPSVKNYKTNFSYKVKQRSLQILRDKMRKNNQPCLLFKKFGYCANQIEGTCPKVHDKKLVAVCRKFLQGKCRLKNCPLSHDVGPEKMPTCKYFLEGFCTREGCPYLHVKVSSKKPICNEFLRGYCPRGNECQNRHIIACPEFDKSGSCSKGKFCPYPHKSLLTETKRPKGSARRKSEGVSGGRALKLKSPSKKQPGQVSESTKRYYDETSEDLSVKRDRLPKQVDAATEEEPLAPAPRTLNEESLDACDASKSNDNARETELVSSRSRRPPIGPLPAYIPIE
ncbi:uncharacterized protein LOC106636709 [Copidosoma floridanum]|uniref:uncharacterized protein LOC106636709 n=1 Tax=Copidosoma floridanum TaxID=29053 RepID=UPI0006C98E32|nr:uncharacterized protein LOC106636709 [Copidosoma floridanum]